MAATEDSPCTQMADQPPVQLDPNVDINQIDDEDVLRKLWQATEDFADKRRIRARMYKLREKRLKDFYNCDDVLGEAPSSRCESPFMMMEAQTAPETCHQVSSVSSVTSYSYSTSGPAEVSTTVEMEVDESTGDDGAVRSSVRRESRRQTTEHNKRRSNDEEDAVSEKIRRKSSERTKRYQQILSEIESTDAEAMDQQPSAAAEAENLGFSCQVTMEGSHTADRNADEGSVIQKTNNTTTTTRVSTVETTTERSERRSSAGEKVVQESTSQRTSSSEGSKGSLTTTSPGSVVQRSVESSSSTQGPLVQLSGILSEGAFSQELKKTSSRREIREGDIITVVQVTETWRRVRETGQSEPITQHVTVTKTTRSRADGTLLEENEDEVIDDLDSASEGQMVTAVDALLSSVTSSKSLSVESVESVEPVQVNEETIVAEKAFLCTLDPQDSPCAVASASADDLSLEESIAREIEEYRQVAAQEDSASQAVDVEASVEAPAGTPAGTPAEMPAEMSIETSTETSTEMSTETEVKEDQVRDIAEASDHNASSSCSAAEEEATAESTGESTPRKLTREQTKLKIKRTPSQSPSRITKRRPDGSVVTKEVDVSPGKKTTTTTTTSASSRTVGGVKQTNNSTTVSRVTTVRSPVKETSRSTTSNIPKLNNSTSCATTIRTRTERSESSELKSLPARKTSNGTSELADESVDEFVKLEQQLEKESAVQDEAEEKYARDILSRPSVLQLDRSYRSLKESSSVERSPSPSSIKRLGLKSSIPSASSPTSSKKSTVTDSLKSSASVKSQSGRPQSPLVTEQRKVTNVETRVTKKSPTSSVPRTSSAVRTVSRQTESKSKVSDLKPGTVVRTVQVTRTVAVREDDKPWRTNSKKEVTKTVYGSGRKGLHGNVMNVVEKYVDTDGCAIHGSHGHLEEQSVDDSVAAGQEGEQERPESLSPPPLIDPKNLDDQPADEEAQQEEEEDAEEFPEPPSAEEIGVDSGLVESANGVDDAELVEVEESADARYREPLSSARQTATETTSVFERIRDETSDARERPSLLFSKDRPPSPSKEKLLSASPVLGSPSVVRKARSLFDTEKSEEAPVVERKSAAATEASSRQSISKIRSAFESPRTGSGQTKTSESIRTEVRTVTSTLRRSSSKEDKSVGKLKSSCEIPAEQVAPEAPVEQPAPVAEPAAPIPEPEAPAPVPEPSNDVEMVAPAETVKSAQIIEEIEDLTLLENMLNTATSYDDRSRIRAQIRIVRKKLGLTGVMPSSASSSPMLQRRNVTTTVQTTGSSGNDATRLTRTFVSTSRKAEESEKRAETAYAGDVTDINLFGLGALRRRQPAPAVVATSDVTDADSVNKEPESSVVASQRTSFTRVESVVESGEPIVVEIEADNSSRRSSSARIISRKSTEITTITKRSSQTSLKTSSTTEQVVQSAPAITSSEDKAAEDSPAETEASESVTWHRSEVTRKGPEDDIREQLEKASPVKNSPWRKMIEKSESSSSVEDKSGNVTTRTLTSKKSQSELKIWDRLPEPEQPAATLDITSSYGTGPMDEYGKPLFGLGALRRRQPKAAVIEDSAPSTPPQPIIIERSQTLNELQKLHEQQQVQQKEPEAPPSSEKPRAKLRDTFTTASSEEADETDSSLSDREPIISERSQALKDIIRKHEHVTSDISMVTEPPPSPKPKAKLKDSFMSTELTTSVEESREPVVERSESFQTIIKRHQELTQTSTSSVPAAPASPVKRPGILKKPKDWSPSPQELPSPVKEDTRKSAEETTTTTTSTSTMATTTTIPRKQSIEIQLNPVDNHLVVVQEVPDAEVVRRSSVITTYTTSSINTIQLRSQEQEDTVNKSTTAGRITDRQESTTTSSRKSSMEIEPVHKATATWTTGKVSTEPAVSSPRQPPRAEEPAVSSPRQPLKAEEATVSSPRQPLKVEEPEIVASSARTSGRFVRATSKTADESGNLVSRLSSRFSRTTDSESKTTDGGSKTSRLIGRFSSRSRDGDSAVTKTTETTTKVTEEAPSSVTMETTTKMETASAGSTSVEAEAPTTGSVTLEATTKMETSSAGSTIVEAEAPTTPRLSRFGSRTTTTTTTTKESVTKTSKMEDDEPVTSRLSRFGSRTREADTASAASSKTTESVTKTTALSKMEDDEPIVVTSRLSRFSSRNRATEVDATPTNAAESTTKTTESVTKTTESSKMEEDEPIVVTSRLSRFGSRNRATDTTSAASSKTTESVTKTTTLSKMEDDEPIVVTSRLSSRLSSRSGDADSTATSAAASTATETTTKTVETSKMEEDEYIPVTSRLSSRFGSRSRADDDSVSTKTIVTSSTTEESEYAPVTSRLSSRFSSRNRQEADSSAKMEAEEAKASPRAPFRLTGDSTGHALNSTSTFQLQSSTTSAASEATSDSASCLVKSSPREPSVPRDDDSAEARSVKTRQELQELSVATRAEVALLTRQTSESGDGLIKEKSRKFSGEPTQRSLPEPKTTGKLPASRYVLQRQESLKLESRIKTMPAGASVRALAQRFQSSAESETPQRKISSGSYPKAGLIFRSSSFRQSASPDRETVRSNVSMVQRSESLRTSSPRIRSRASVERQSQEREETTVESETVDVTSDHVATPRDSQISTPRSVTTTERRTYQTTTVKSSDSPPDVNVSTGSSVSVELSPAQTANSSVTTTTTKSFLEDRTPVRGMQDIIGRMKAETNGTTSEDDRALSLLNKFLGAQILVQCTEPLVNSQTPDVVETVTTSQHLSQDGKSLTRSTTANRAGSQHQVTSGSDDQGRTWKQETSSSVSATKTLTTTNRVDDNLPGSMAQACIVDGVDINTCDDDFKLNELLDNCNDYETRCKLRARIKFLLSNSKGPADAFKTGRNSGSTVVTQNQVVTRQTTTRTGQSAFAKFQQLDKTAKTSPR